MQTSEIYKFVIKAMNRAKISKDAKFEVQLWLREREAYYARKEMQCPTTTVAGTTSTPSSSSSGTPDTPSSEQLDLMESSI